MKDFMTMNAEKRLAEMPKEGWVLIFVMVRKGLVYVHVWEYDGRYVVLVHRAL
jgi:hypothetical protein